jgi:hypothetical protein
MTARWLEPSCSRPSLPDPDLVVSCGELVVSCGKEANNCPHANPDNQAIGDAGAGSHCHPAALTPSEHSARTVFAGVLLRAVLRGAVGSPLVDLSAPGPASQPVLAKVSSDRGIKNVVLVHGNFRGRAAAGEIRDAAWNG